MDANWERLSATAPARNCRFEIMRLLLVREDSIAAALGGAIPGLWIAEA